MRAPPLTAGGSLSAELLGSAYPRAHWFGRAIRGDVIAVASLQPREASQPDEPSEAQKSPLAGVVALGRVLCRVLDLVDVVRRRRLSECLMSSAEGQCRRHERAGEKFSAPCYLPR